MGCCARCDMGLSCPGGVCGVKPVKELAASAGFMRGSLPFGRPVARMAASGGHAMVRASGDAASDAAAAAAAAKTAQEKLEFDQKMAAAQLAIDSAFKAVNAGINQVNYDKQQAFDLAVQQSKERIALGQTDAATELAKAQQMLATLTSQKLDIAKSKPNDCHNLTDGDPKYGEGCDPNDPTKPKFWTTPMVIGAAVAGTAVVGTVAYFLVRKSGGRRR